MSKRLVTKNLVPLSPLQGQRQLDAPETRFDECDPKGSEVGEDLFPASRDATPPRNVLAI